MKIADITKTQGAVGGGLIGAALGLLIEANGWPAWLYLAGAGCLFAFALVYSLWPGERHKPGPSGVSLGYSALYTPITATEVQQVFEGTCEQPTLHHTAHVTGGTALRDLGFEAAACTHGVTFDPAVAKGLCVADIRRRWPRHSGKCADCGYLGIEYASHEHYVAGDW